MKFYTNITQWGDNLLVREYKDGQRVNRKIKYQPTLYTVVSKPTEYKTLEGKYVTPMKHTSMKEAKEWVNNYKNQPHLIYGNTSFAYNYIADEYPNEVKWDSEKLLLVTIDIEVECENGFPNPEEASEPLLSITIKNHQSKEIIVWGLKDFTTDREDVTYILCDSEKTLLNRFVTFWTDNYPDIITGWNTEFFDLPYICNRISRLFDEKMLKKLSPWGNVSSRNIYSQGRSHQVYEVQGIAHLDYYDLYRKFTYTNQESYRLDHIAFVELGERKDGNPFETFREWYTKDYQSFIEYNITDVELVDKLEDKLKLIELCLTMAYDAKVNYMDVLGTTKYWDILIYNYLRGKNIVIPQKIEQKKSSKFEGAYVKDPQVGEHKWVMSFDLNSLYPHLIMQYNISPETLYSKKPLWQDSQVEEMIKLEKDTSALKKKNVTLTPNGALFKTDKKGFLPEIMQKIYDDRVSYKKLMIQAKKEYERTKNPKLIKDIARYNNIQMAKKISLNSAYGAIGNNWFRYYNILVAEAITTSGQLSIRYIEHSINKYINSIIGTSGKDFILASDTDSVYITFDELVSKVFREGAKTEKIINFLDTVAREKIEPFIDKSYSVLSEYINAYEQKMSMKREVIADKAVWVAKKRYILNAWDVEGVRYKEPQLKIMGIEAVKSSTPAPCREKLKSALKIIMNGDSSELNDFIQDFRKKFMELPAEEIAYPRSVNGLDKFTTSHNLFSKGAPIHCKGAILYNHLLRKQKLTHKYPFIQEGDKIKFVHMKTPNVYQSTAMSFMTRLPKEFNVQDKIDYDMQFEKSFMEPLKFITDKIRWKLDESYGTQGTLEEFFV
jgi:DNA polymerase elongation subunit (family B)